MEGGSPLARNCAYVTFEFKRAKHLPNIPLYPKTNIISQSQAYATPILKSQAMEYIKSLHHVCIVCVFASKCDICKLVPTPEIHLQIYGTSNNPCEK